MAAGAAAGAWVLVLSLWGEPCPTPNTNPPRRKHSAPVPEKLPTTSQEPGYCFSISLIRPVLVLLAPISLPAPPLWCCLPGAVVGDQNITARIGKPLVLNCKGAPKKPPQQLEWKLNTGRTEAWKVLSPQGGPWDSVARVLPNGSLLLPSVGIQDEGTFRCRAMSRKGKETKSNYRVRVYQIPGKPEIVDPASELMAGVPDKVGICVSKGGYPAGTLSWHLDGKTLIPDGKEPAPLEEVLLMVEPEGGAVAPGGTVTLTCEAPAQPPPQIHWIKDGMPLPLPPSSVLLLPEVGPEDQGTYSCVATHPSHGPQESHAVSVSIIETGEEGLTAGSVEGPELGTLALALGILGGLGTAALLIGVIMWQRRQRRGEERKDPENQEEEEEERTELNQPEEPEAAESSAGEP
ncbi:advanced glycosylation end product-specific receptor isoform X7 [Balaenoptera ricei]|uniref:advanced glycosylation end product-specific receptor isoform X7 n=1 Tax=Balaenoptera ricei TaxID=2746895 RepID=UPI0028BF169B|nr:advanced glycosylation end product-specific receptor isoform X7 [Balaenoptera ricei]